MKKKLLRFTACLAAALVLSAAGAGARPALNQAGSVQAAAAIEADEKDGQYILTYGNDKTRAKDGYYSIPGNITCGDITIKKGVYHFKDGYFDLTSTAAAAANATVNVLSATGSESPKAYVLTRTKSAKTSSSISSGVTLFTGLYGGKIYQDGVTLASGYAYINNIMYKVSGGTYSAKTKFTGVLKSSYVDASKSALVKASGYYYKEGKPATGVVNLQYYKAGKPTSVTGWKKMNSRGMYNGAAVYYFKKGKAVTGWHYLKSYGGGSAKYKYNFRSNGTLRTNLFAWKRSYYIKQKLYIKTNLTTHNTTIYVYDKATGKYDIPAITAVCSTSRKKNGTRPVKKTYIQKTSARKWFIYKKSNPWHYYQYGVLINGSASWYHSTMYKTKKANSLVNPTSSSGYNYLGTNQTTACIRQQAGMARLIYDIAVMNRQPRASLKKQKERVWVDIYRSGDKGPFGKITLKDSSSKLKSGVKKDPTDPKYGNSLFK